MKSKRPLAVYFRREASKDVDQAQPLGIRTMLSIANKLGPSKAVRTFNRSLAATCCAPRQDGASSASAVCRGACYFYQMSSGRDGVVTRAVKNDEIVRRLDFKRLMVGALLDARISAVRIHDFGDFDTVAYIRNWYDIASMLPDVSFWAYTRAWRIPELLPELIRLAGLSNVDVLFSADQETGMPQNVDGIGVAWFANNDGAVPAETCSVVFRATRERNPDEDLRRRAARTSSVELPIYVHGRNVVELANLNGTPVCPLERGTPVRSAYSDCLSCQLCMPKMRAKRQLQRQRARSLRIVK